MADHNAALVAWCSPVDSAAAEELERWYVEFHVPEVTAAVPGVVGVRRYVLSDVSADGSTVPRFLAIYELQTDDVAGAARALADARHSFTPTTTMDWSDNAPLLQWYTSRPSHAVSS